MKRLLLILGASTLTASLTAQHLPDETHCRLDEALMIASNWGEKDHQKLSFTYDAADHLLGTMTTQMHEGIEGPGEWTPLMRSVCTNNAAGLPAEIVMESYDNELQQWVNDGKTLYEYDSKGNCIKTEEYSHPWTDEGISPELVIAHSETDTYDDQNRIISTEGIFYTDGQIESQYKYTFAYGTYGIESETLSELNGGSWEVSNLMEYTYNAKGLMVQEDSYQVTGGEKSLFSKRVFEYDGQGHPTAQYHYYKQYWDNEPKLETITYYTCNNKGLVITEELSWADEGSISQRQEYTYDEHDDLVNRKSYSSGFDPETWEVLPYLVLHEEDIYTYKCTNGSNLEQIGNEQQQKQQGCMLINGKLVIVNGNKSFDVMGRRVN